ncbi:MAG: methionine aminotransferase [Acidobacteriota bacterium]
MSRLPYLSSRLQGFGTTIFTTMTVLAQKHDAINLGQGFPDFDGPDFIKEAAHAAIDAGHNQYAPMPGVLRLREAIARHQERFYDLSYDPGTEIVVTTGATEALAAAVIALCEVGDEVVMFEPFYDSYRAVIAMAGAVPKLYTLEPPDFAVDPEKLEALITPKTRLMLINSPHNPTGHVLAREDLAVIARLCEKHDLLAISDEVYEHLVYEGEHVPLATIDGMRERTLTISSTGKTFSFTGWKVGWCCAPPALTSAVTTVHQFLTFSGATPFQHAMADALDQADDAYYASFVAEYASRRKLLCDSLERVGLEVHRPQGSYFVLADIRSIGEEDGVEFCNTLPARAGVAAIPAAAFYTNKNAGRPLVRFAFCKSADVIERGTARLAVLQS